MKRKLTPEQEAKRQERKARFVVMVKQIGDMTDAQRAELCAKMGQVVDDIAGKVREIAALLDSNTTDPDQRVSEAGTLTDLATEIVSAGAELEQRFYAEYQHSKDLAKEAEMRGAA